MGCAKKKLEILMREHRSTDFQKNSALQVEETNYDHTLWEWNNLEVLFFFFKYSLRAILGLP